MIRVDRSKVPPPAVLSEPFKSDGKTELERASEHMNGPDKDKTFEFSRYKSAEVKEALEKLFHGKCAYCESSYSSIQPVDVEHFRPKGKVEGDDVHPGYWWLAMEWTNLLPSCIDCNRRRNQRTPKADRLDLVKLTRDGDLNRAKQLATGKACAFPLADDGVRCALPPGTEPELIAEKALLLDPTRDNPEDHLVFVVSREHQISLVGAKMQSAAGGAFLPPADAAGEADAIRDAANKAEVSAKGAISIQVYGLNRLGLVQARTRVLRDLELLLEISIGLTELSLEIAERNKALTKKKKSVSAMAGRDLQVQIDFNAAIQRKILFYTNEVKTRFSEMIDPKAPYAAVSRAWVRAYLAD
ncbi:hypothetical protein [Rhizobium sp. L1K21]|uniref:hypothetical protein n=1 Tax=Rhizobium sp. L1K21 TaxID=2954933 RepID=UPI0020930A26|nr:hypothetical protein [Rhizobium sp. L1K21]MCO6187896.1 hypothetical protein [Rhizobium sp. L1K21]